jgi:hypothetical protein
MGPGGRYGSGTTLQQYFEEIEVGSVTNGGPAREIYSAGIGILAQKSAPTIAESRFRNSSSVFTSCPGGIWQERRINSRPGTLTPAPGLQAQPKRTRHPSNLIDPPAVPSWNS